MSLRSYVAGGAALVLNSARLQMWRSRALPDEAGHRATAKRSDLRGASAPSAQDEGVDCAFYRTFYVDLRHMTDAQLRTHYRLHGCPEGRFPDQAAYERDLWHSLRALIEQSEDLPGPFNWRDYLALNKDLWHIGSEVEAKTHYVRYGRAEGRAWRLFDHDLYRHLYFDGTSHSREWLMDHFDREGRERGWLSKGRDLLKVAGLADSSWLDRVEVSEFGQLNAHWAGPIRSLQDVLSALCADDFAQMAPLSFDLAFDPNFYREKHPEMATESNEALYRSWLFDGIDAARAGTGRAYLRRLDLPLSSYPDGFDFVGYRSRHCRDTDDRWSTLEHALKIGMPLGKFIPVKGQRAGDFLTAVARHSERHASHRAISVYNAAIAARDPPHQARTLLASAYVREGRWQEASVAYSEILRSGDFNIDVCVNAVEAALQLDDASRAFNILSLSKALVGGDVRYREALRKTIDKAFRDAWIAAERLYRAEYREEADEIMLKVVRRIADAWAQLDPLGIKLPVSDPRRIVMLANTDLAQCTFYRVAQKADVFKAAGFSIEVYEQHEVEAFITALPGAGAAIFYRLPAMPMNIRAIQITNAMAIPSLYDIDDLIFDPRFYPEPIETYGRDVSREFYGMLQLGVPLFRSAMAMCTHGIASTTALAAHMATVVETGEVFVLPNGLDDRTMPFLKETMRRVRHDEGPVIFYGSGTKAHNSDFMDLAGDALVEVLENDPKARLFVAGYLSLDERFDALSSQIMLFGPLPDVKDYWSLLAEADINIAVLASGPTTDAKSEIKWMEAALVGVPSIVSGTHRYMEVLADGEDALIARTPSEWRSALRRLIEDPRERQRIVANARAKIGRHYSVEANAEVAKAIVAAVTPLPPTGVERRKRILLVNIFFPPQTIGGSTRVVRDNLDHFIDVHGDAFEFAVVTSDNDALHPHRMRVENYRGCPVFRIAPAHRDNLEWNPFDPKVGALFRRILASFAPDLVHFHCVQRLSASIILECRAADVPYITTVHDAWWLSDYHFLVDQRGTLHEPNEPMPTYPPAPATLSQALNRRRLLRELLERSVEVLGVSEAFTKIYRDCGYTRARVVANGVPPLVVTKRRPSKNGKVRLAHIGSMTHHKGYYLVQAAFLRSNFPNLELTIVDHSRFGGAHDVMRWGDTCVTFVGKTKQEDMHEFYSSIDVLLAPSIWPESFGLVTREALAAGCWVLASDRGAVGDSIEPGVNGWIIDVSTTTPLVEVLTAIDANHKPYLRSPAAGKCTIRSAADQGEELISIYRDVLSRPCSRTPAPAIRGWMPEDPPYLASAMRFAGEEGARP